MASYVRQKPATWFWVVAVLITLWGAMGIIAFYGDITMNEATLATLPEWDQAFYRSRPGWFVWLYGIAVWSGLFGGIALLFRRVIAGPLFIVSLAAAVLMFGWMFLATDVIAEKGAAMALPFPLLIILIAAAELWFAGYAKRRGWIL